MRILAAAAAALALVLPSTQAAAATVLTFDDLAQPGTGVRDLANGDRWEYGGFAFQSFGGSPAFRSFRAQDSRNADPGGAAIFHNYSNTSMLLSKADGSTFDLVSIDVADLQNSGQRFGNSFDFYYADGTSDSFSFTTDALVGLETILLNRRGLTSVRLSTPYGNWWQLDNIAIGTPVSPVPEPATWAMMILGFAGVGSALRRRRAAARGVAIEA